MSCDVPVFFLWLDCHLISKIERESLNLSQDNQLVKKENNQGVVDGCRLYVGSQVGQLFQSPQVLYMWNNVLT